LILKLVLANLTQRPVRTALSALLIAEPVTPTLAARQDPIKAISYE
jgi:hypothetical protein